MKNLFNAALILLILNNFCFAQRYFYDNFLIMPQGYPIGTLNGFGTSKLINNAANLNSLNPAAMDNFHSLSFGASYLYETKLNDGWIGGIGGHRIDTYFPESAGLVVPLQNLRFGFSLGQIYNWFLDIGKVPVTTVDQPDGTGEFLEPFYKTKVYSYSFMTSFTLDNIFNDDDFTFGVRFSRNRLYGYQDLDILPPGPAEDISYANNFSLGGTYKHYFNNNRFIQLGLAYDSPIKFTGVMNYHDYNNPVIPLEGGRNVSYYYLPIRYISTVPGKISLDYNVESFSKIKILGGFNYILWNTSTTSNWENQIEINGSFLYPFNTNLTGSLGFYGTGFNFKEDYFGENSKLDAVFLTGGLVLSYKIIYLDLSIADSHLFSGAARKQTIGKFGVGISL